MKKVLLVLAIIATLGAKAQTSIGTIGGLTLTKESKYYNTALYGAWIDLGRFGFQYSASGSFNGSQSEMEDYISGRSKEFNAGIVSKNYGIFVNIGKSLYVGLGAQSSKYYNAEIEQELVTTVHSGPITVPGAYIAGIGYITPSRVIGTQVISVSQNLVDVPVVALHDKTTPYGVVGIRYNLGTSFIGRAEVMISKVSSINVGIGIKIK
jgi:hypothetical protein